MKMMTCRRPVLTGIAGGDAGTGSTAQFFVAGHVAQGVVTCNLGCTLEEPSVQAGTAAKRNRTARCQSVHVGMAGEVGV